MESAGDDFRASAPLIFEAEKKKKPWEKIELHCGYDLFCRLSTK